MKRHEASERRACKVVGLSRRVKRYSPLLSDVNTKLRAAMLVLVGKFPRFGYRRITALLRREVSGQNRKCIYRLWREEGLKVPVRRKRLKNKGHCSSSIANQPSEHINHIWTWDFVSSSTRSGKELRWLVRPHSSTRECLHLEARRSWPATDVLESVMSLMSVRGIPLCLRSDNGPEFVATHLRDSLTSLGLNLLYVEPGSPWQNGSIESFNACFRDEWLNEQSFHGVTHANTGGSQFLDYYNNTRPHSSLNYETPREYAERLGDSNLSDSKTRQERTIKQPSLHLKGDNYEELSN